MILDKNILKIILIKINFNIFYIKILKMNSKILNLLIFFNFLLYNVMN